MFEVVKIIFRTFADVSEQKIFKKNTNFIQTNIAALCDLYRTFALYTKRYIRVFEIVKHLQP
nr:MAG TPA: hypothetical protein [Caudoviricetes sp.]